MKKALYTLVTLLYCSVVSFSQDSQESIILNCEGKSGQEVTLSIQAEGDVSIKGAKSVKKGEQGKYICVLPYSDDPYTTTTLTINASRILGLTLDYILVTGLDLSHAPSLTHLVCRSSGSTIQRLDLSALESLIYLDCSNQNLGHLNLEKNGKLETLLCSGNKLTELGVKHLTELKQLDCSENLLTNLTVSNLDKLEILNAKSNKINTIKIDNLISLKEFQISHNPLGGTLKIDLPKLNFLSVSFCGLENLVLEQAPELMHLDCTDNKLSSLSFVNTPNIVSIDCFHNRISGEEMRKTIQGLPDYSPPTNAGEGKCYAVSYGTSIGDPDEMEKNFAYENDIRKAIEKQWAFYAVTKNGEAAPYTGRPMSSQQIANDEIIISPNPAKDFISIQGISTHTVVSILDLSGKRLLESQGNSNETLNLDVRSIPEGNYLVVINGRSHKLVITR